MRSSSLLLYSLCLVFPFNLVYAANSSLANTTFTSLTESSSNTESIPATQPLLTSATASARNLTVSSVASSNPATTSTAVVVSSSAAPSHMSSSVTVPQSSSPVKSSSPKPPSAVITPPPPGLPPASNQTMSSSSDTLTKSSSHTNPPPSTVEASPSKSITTTIKSNPSSNTSPSPISHSSSSSFPAPGPPPPPSAPPSSSTSHNNGTSIHTTAATTTSIVVVHVPNSSLPPSTITTQADSTFATPVAVTSTEANGAKIITTPPLVTVISTSTESNGAAATFTHVIANPNFTGNNQNLASNSGFFHKRGAVAGVFVVIGIAVAALVVALAFCVRRKRRINRRRRWLEGMKQQRSPSFARDPFQDPTFGQEQKVQPLSGPSIRSPQEDVRWDRGSPDFLLSEGQTLRQYNNGIFPQQATFALYPDPYPITNMVSSDMGERHNIGLAQAMQTPDRARFRHSYTPSTPSVYPATLAPDEDIHRPADEEASKPMQRESIIPAPPRPPRSHLRESAKNLSGYSPPTPPASNSSISHANDSNPPSPISLEHRQDLFTRRTLLDVRNQQVMKGLAI